VAEQLTKLSKIARLCPAKASGRRLSSVVSAGSSRVTRRWVSDSLKDQIFLAGRSWYASAYEDLRDRPSSHAARCLLGPIGQTVSQVYAGRLVPARSSASSAGTGSGVLK